ncbi:hypothetical protein BT96DRAFT_914477 [Gymnopus androsaceus JB14]|uniref:Dbl homology domain-containing protein n=1 Tax=Gymnopus androsaceus JB14 TaxID=1447944 RepID=A0A6A4IAZ5_9AGAR|nr:hypothetical protein BT96DRAFT_914477 [Gymnopus androsaceus JB14]
MSYYSHPSRPHVSIPQPQIPHGALPPGAQRPINPSPSTRSYTPWAFEVTPPAYPEEQFGSLQNPWEDGAESPDTLRHRTLSLSNLPSASRSPSRAASFQPGMSSAPVAFPEPHIYRSASQRPVGHKPSKSDASSPSLMLQRDTSTTSFQSTHSWYYDDDDAYGSASNEEGLARFQSAQLPDNDQEWHRLVPPEAIEALGKTEVQRQSVIFEVFKAERDYVADLQAVQDVYITPLVNAQPPVIQQNRLQGYISEVFGNFSQILGHHQRMLGALFSRQREQHPLVQSIADIVLDTTLKSDFRSAYETYIKHYPLSESHHRKELERNPAYQSFMQSASSDPRIRKRDLITFLSRPSTQPGIESAESKVKFWALCESLVYRKGEIIDMDLYDKSRTLTGNWSGSGWTDLSAALLDSYFLLTREEQRPNGQAKRHLMSRPLYLSFLRLGSFNSPPETRKEHPKDGSVLGGLLYQSTSLYPFTIYHAASKLNRRYTLYVTSEAIRQKWHDFFKDAIAVHKVRQEGNMFFAPDTISQQFFGTSGGSKTGKILAAVPFSFEGRQFIIAACASGVYVTLRGHENFHKVLKLQPTSMAALQTLGTKTFNKFIVHVNSSLLSYPLALMARVALGQAEPKTLDASMEKVVSSDVLFFKHLHVGPRVLLVYAVKKMLQTTLSVHVLEVLDISHNDAALTPKRENRGKAPSSFRPFGDAGYVPKDAFDVTPLVKTIGICARGGIVIVDPTNISSSRFTVVPDFTKASSNQPMANLKSRVDNAKPLGLIRSDANELLVIYDTIGCYITKHGTPSRSSGYIKWESKIDSFAQRGAHVLLFSSQFIEIRHILTSRVEQVIEGQDIRMMYAGPTPDSRESILVVMRGEEDSKQGSGVGEKIVELQETTEISASTGLRTPTTAMPTAMWDEWDM